MENIDLKNKAIYDFTNNPEIIKKIVGNTSKEFYIDRCHIINKMSDIVDFAYLIQDDRLHKLATKALEEVQKEWDSIVADGLKDDIIVD